jgi:hypothetical protein
MVVAARATMAEVTAARRLVPPRPYHRVALAEPRISSVLRRRDRVMIVAFLLVNVAVILAVVLLRSDDDSKKGSAARTPRPGRVVANRSIGARIHMPIGWLDESGDRSIVLRSPDSTTVMSISLPPGAKDNRLLLHTSVGVISQQYTGVRVRRTSGKVAGLPAVSRVVTATNKKGVRLTILVSAPRGRNRAWLVEVFSGPGAKAKRLPEAQVALGTLRLRG